MATLKIPYGRDNIMFDLDDSRINAIIEPIKSNLERTLDEHKIVCDSLSNPIESPRLRNISKNRNKVLLITSDHTRPMPSRLTIPLLLSEIRQGNKNAEIVILVATGCHRAMNHQEMLERFGPDLVSYEKIVNHDCTKNQQLIFKGFLPSGGELWLNALVDWADLIISEGFIEPHFFAGFSGGRKSILPGIASEKTVLANHCSEFIANNASRAGILSNNPIHKDMLYAAEKVNLKFILNVVLDSKKNIMHAYCGDYIKAHEEGCKKIREIYSYPMLQTDIVITSNGGYPLDQNIYQAVKGLSTAESCVKPDGVIIIASSCCDGHGGDDFYNLMIESKTPQDLFYKISKTKRICTKRDQWQAQILARVLMKAKVIFVTEPSNRNFIENMHMTYAFDLHHALQIAEAVVGKNSSITIIPDGVSTIIRNKDLKS